MGFKISPAIGLVVSELVLDGRGRSVDISAFDPGRFAAGGAGPIKAQWEYGDEEPAAYT
jgi:glycine/D-amino acid oxidase-like deaminating enzyme